MTCAAPSVEVRQQLGIEGQSTHGTQDPIGHQIAAAEALGAEELRDALIVDTRDPEQLRLLLDRLRSRLHPAKPGTPRDRRAAYARSGDAADPARVAEAIPRAVAARANSVNCCGWMTSAATCCARARWPG